MEGEGFRSSLDELDKTNRWVMLGDLLPWAEIEKRYNSTLNNQVKGAGNKPARLIGGAMIIKHKLNLGDEGTILMIQENPYMQYMCGLPVHRDEEEDILTSMHDAQSAEGDVPRGRPPLCRPHHQHLYIKYTHDNTLFCYHQDSLNRFSIATITKFTKKSLSLYRAFHTIHIL